MANLRIRQTDGSWGVMELDEPEYYWEAGVVPPGTGLPEDGSNPLASMLRLRYPDGKEAWAIVAAPEAGNSVNGVPLTLGVKVLSDRDLIQIGEDRKRAYFSTETTARVESFPGLDRPTTCPRCTTIIEPGSPAVRCPGSGCGVWHHANEELPCWTYSEHCATCKQETSLESEYAWCPEEE
jgi:hypothetical protein